jgi:hypothetical protein
MSLGESWRIVTGWQATRRMLATGRTSTRREQAVERRIPLTSGLVGPPSIATTVVAVAKAGAPWWGVLIAVLAMVLMVVLIVVVDLHVTVLKLHMAYRLVVRLAKRPLAGSFKGPWHVELTGPTQPASPGFEPLEPRHWIRRKPPPDS